MEETAKDAFLFCQRVGEVTRKDIHILDIGSSPECFYRVYTKDGNCINISKTFVCDPVDFEKNKEEFEDLDPDGNVYLFLDECFEGFNRIPLDRFLHRYTR